MTEPQTAPNAVIAARAATTTLLRARSKPVKCMVTAARAPSWTATAQPARISRRASRYLEDGVRASPRAIAEMTAPTLMPPQLPPWPIRNGTKNDSDTCAASVSSYPSKIAVVQLSSNRKRASVRARFTASNSEDESGSSSTTGPWPAAEPPPRGFLPTFRFRAAFSLLREAISSRNSTRAYPKARSATSR